MYHKPTERVLNILTYLANQIGGASLSNLSSNLGIPKSTIFPILQEMTYQNYLYFDIENNKYHIGITTQAIAATYDPISEIFPLIQQEMKEITRKANEICQLGILEGPNVLYISKEEPQKPLDIQIISYVGKRIPAYCTALGKALLEDYSISQIEQLYPEGLAPLTENTLTDVHKLKEQLDLFHKEGIFYEEEEVTPHLCCYATPINLVNNQKIAVSVSLPNFRADQKKRKLIRELLLNLKKKFNSKDCR
ncbi:IclR family transcriptional regulator [[Pasteurella] aerogenes]|nr:IclR family transcriptional regulator [[Pasteurella] aerogenes]